MTPSINIISSDNVLRWVGVQLHAGPSLTYLDDSNGKRWRHRMSAQSAVFHNLSCHGIQSVLISWPIQSACDTLSKITGQHKIVTNQT